MPNPTFPDLPQYEAGCRMPSNNTIIAGDSFVRVSAEIGSDRLLRALLVYGSKHGLPNIDADQCRAKLATDRLSPKHTERALSLTEAFVAERDGEGVHHPR